MLIGGILTISRPLPTELACIFFFFLKSHTHSLASIGGLKSCFWSVGGNLLISKEFSVAYRIDC